VSQPQRPDLRGELLQRVERDQEVRHALGDEPTTEQWDAMAAVDLENYTWLEQVIAVHGWPGFRLVDEDGAEAAWLIAQHAPKHLQQQWLPLLRTAVETGDGHPTNLAYLDDRVRCRKRRGQLHGTQWFGLGDGSRLFPLEDPEHVNDRREALGLWPLEAEEIANAWGVEVYERME